MVSHCMHMMARQGRKAATMHSLSIPQEDHTARSSRALASVLKAERQQQLALHKLTRGPLSQTFKSLNMCFGAWGRTVVSLHGMAERHHTAHSNHSPPKLATQPDVQELSPPRCWQAMSATSSCVRMQLYLTEFHCKAAQGSSHSRSRERPQPLATYVATGE
jgi:hypothetical protein